MIWLKHLHLLCVTLSVAGFIIRGGLVFTNSPILKQRWIKVMPHLVDTVLLLSGIGLAVMWPWAALAPWLTYKLAALVAYIALGFMAFRIATRLHTQMMAWIAALLVVVYLVGVAFYKSPLSWWI